MKKINFIIVITICFITQLSYSQFYQKSYGKVFDNTNTDQQELQSIIDFDQQSLVVSGTFRNVNTFPELAFYGTISKINKDGNLLWHKGYMPSDIISYDSFFISSQVKTINNEYFAIGCFLGNPQNSGYILLKLDASGEIIFSKKISDEFADLNPKIISNDTNLFAILGNKVIKFDLQGNIINSISSFSLSFRDITIDTSGNIIIVGDYISSDPNNTINTGLPVIRLSQNLSFINGGLFYSDELGSLYAHSVVTKTNGDLIVGGESIYFSIDSNNNTLWAKSIPNFTSAPESDSYNAILNLKKDINETIYFTAKGFYSSSDNIYEPTNINNSDEDNFQHYTVICSVNPLDGTILNSKEIKYGFLNSINHIEATNFFIDNDYIYAAGSIRDFYGEYKLNYLHRTDKNGVQCGETNRSISVNDIIQDLNYIALPSDTFNEINLQTSPIVMTVVNIPINYENQSCSQSLSINDNELDDIVIYPNPSSTMITIAGSSLIQKIKISDSLGRLVTALNGNSINQYDISFLTNGVYLLELDIDDKVYYKKLLKN